MAIMARGNAPRTSWALAGKRRGTASHTSNAATPIRVITPAMTALARWARSRRLYIDRGYLNGILRRVDARNRAPQDVAARLPGPEAVRSPWQQTTRASRNTGLADFS